MSQPNDPLEMMKSMWGNMGFALPGMVTPTVDTDELGKRIADLKAVEGWLKSNLSLLQMSIQGLEMQRNTLLTLQHMQQTAHTAQGGAGNEAAANPFLNPATWQVPWNLMSSAMNGGLGSATDNAAAATGAAPAAPADESAGTRQTAKPKR